MSISDPFVNSPPLSWGFHTEIIGLTGLVIILAFALLTRSYWKYQGYSLGIFNMVVIVFFFMIYALYSSEFQWHVSGAEAYAPFYATERFSSTLFLVFVKFFLLSLTSFCLLVYKPFFLGENNTKWEYPILLLVITIAMLLMISTIDAFIFFVAMEVQTLVLFIMIGLKRYSNLSMEAAQKFFFFAAFSTCCFGLGISLLYSLTGTSNLYHWSSYFDALTAFSQSFQPLAFLGGLFILVSLLFKLALIPFHFWVGDVFQGTFGYFNSYLAIVSKLPVLVFFAKFFYWVLVFISPYFVLLLKTLSIISIVGGALYAFTELNFKRFWALTSIVNVAYITLAISMDTGEGLAVAIFYSFLYFINTFFVWILVLHLVKKPRVDFAFNEFLTKLVNWTALSQHRLPLALFFVFVLFSLAGLPPGAGFLPKAWLLLHLYASQDFSVAFIVLLTSFLSMAYYIRLARFVLFPPGLARERAQESFEPISSFYVYLLLGVFFLNLFFIVFFFDLTVMVLALVLDFLAL